MKTRLLLSPLATLRFLVVCCAFCSVVVQAQPDSAAIHGRVLNVVTGQYLNNVRIAVRGADTIVFTDETGRYRLPRVSAGRVMLDVFYTGLDAQAVAVDAVAGQSIEKNIELTSAARYGGEPGVVKLDSFVVATARDTDGNSIAINEQRFAPNIKNIVAADALGDVMDGNVGELMKFLPGITADYDNEDGSTVAYISIRGFAHNLASVSSDGSPMASTSNTFGDSRSFSFNNVSINNVARIEVTKVPTPANPADSLAGSVNMVSKSAFERKDLQFRYNVHLTANSENLDLEKTAHTTEEDIFKILPGGNFDLTVPFSSRFGIVLTGLSTRRFTKQQRSTTTYNTTGTATGASLARPFMQTYAMFNSPRVIERDSLGFKADWRVTPNSVLSAGAQWSLYESGRLTTAMSVNTGNNGTPTPASGTPMSFGEDFTVGATGRGALGMAANASLKSLLESRAANLRYRFDDGRWRLEASVNRSTSKGGYRSPEHSGYFRQFTVAARTPVRVTFRGLDLERPQTIEVFDNNNQPVDYQNPANYVLNTANATPRETRDQLDAVNVDLRRTLDFLPFPAAIQGGGAVREQTRDIRRWNQNWTYAGMNGDTSPRPFISPLNVNDDNHYGFADFPHLSPVLAWRAFQRNPALFTKTAAQVRAEELFRIVNSLTLEERVSALYLQAEFNLLRDRLKIVTGARYEKTEAEGTGPAIDASAVFQRNPDGTFVRNAAGQRIRRPAAGAAGSLEELSVTHRERAASNRQNYHGYYPSLHLTYNITPNLLARAAYARTYGRPDLEEIFPNTSIDEFDEDNPAAVQGNITVRNSNLRPWSADNFDLSLEYYTARGGLFSAGVFQKDIRGFFSNAVRIATLADTQALGIDSDYVGWRVTSRYNGGDARILGAEFNLRHSLAALGSWGRPWSVFVNGTKLDLQDEQDAAFGGGRGTGGFIPETLNWGFTFSRRPVQVMAKWNYRGKQRGEADPAFGPDGFIYFDRRLALDLNVDFQLRKEMFLFLNAQNVFDAPHVNLIYGSQTPDYAKRRFTNHNGVGITLGIKGSF